MFDTESLAIQRAINNLNMEHAKAVHQLLTKLVSDGALDSEKADLAFKKICAQQGLHA